MSVLCLTPHYLKDFRCTAACPLGGDAAHCPARSALRIRAIYEQSLRLVCPAAVARVLRHADGLHFVNFALPAAPRTRNEEIPGLAEPTAEASFLLDLQRASLHLLGLKKYSVDVRLILLGLFLEDAGDYIESGRGGRLGEIVKSYDTPLFDQRFSAALGSLKFDPVRTLDYLWGIVKKIVSAPGSPLTREDIALAQNVYHLGGAPDLARVARAVTVSRRSLRTYVYLRFPGLRERLLLHEFYTELYPCALKGGLIHNYWCFVLAEKIALLFLAALAAMERANLTEEKVCTLLTRLVRLPQHPAALAAIEATLTGHEDDSLTLFALLFPVNDALSSK